MTLSWVISFIISFFLLGCQAAWSVLCGRGEGGEPSPTAGQQGHCSVTDIHGCHDQGMDDSEEWEWDRKENQLCCSIVDNWRISFVDRWQSLSNLSCAAHSFIRSANAACVRVNWNNLHSSIVNKWYNEKHDFFICSTQFSTHVEMGAAIITVRYNINVWVQDCSNSPANALELLQSCTKPSTWYCIQHCTVFPWLMA